MLLPEVIGQMRTFRALPEPDRLTGGAAFWSKLFKDFFVDSDGHADDLVMLVKGASQGGGDGKKSSKKGGGASGSGPATGPDSVLDVYRRGSATRPMPAPGDPRYNWEETVCLNILLQQVTYMLTCAVCTRDPRSKKLKVLRQLQNQVYPSPSKRNMEEKTSDEVITFPQLYFSIDDFDQRFEDVVVSPDECVCVELVAKMGEVRTTVFSGAVKHTQLAASFSSKSRQWLSSKLNPKKKEMQFLHMLGPRGLGQAEMAVSISEKAGGADGAGGSTTGLGGALRKLGRAGFAMVKDIASGGPDASQCPLNAYLTFVSLSWETMVDNLVENVKAPALGPVPVAEDAAAANRAVAGTDEAAKK